MQKQPEKAVIIQPQPRYVSGGFFFLFFGTMCYEAARLFWPFIGAIGSAIVLSVVFRPWYDALERWRPRWSPTWRALLMDTAIGVLFLIPVALLAWSAVDEAQNLYPVLAQKITHAGGLLHQSPTETFPWLNKLPPSIVGSLNIHSAEVQQHLSEASQRIFGIAAGASTLFAKRAADLVLDLLILVFCLFFMFRDGPEMYKQAQALIPLSPRSKARLNLTMKRTIVGVVRGTVLMSLAQTTMMAIGLLVVHAQAVVLLCFLTFAATFIPTVGTALISVPAAIYYLVVGVHWKGIFLLVWGTFGMGVIDNVLRPFLVGAGEEMSFFWLVFAVLGGLEAFGITGLLLGPLILSLMPVLFSIYRERYLDIPEDHLPATAASENTP